MKRYKDFMEGYVPSADKKPAADGRMLPARKIKTNKPDPTKETKPAEGGLGEKMDLAKADMGDVIKDFQKSDAPQFKGKSDKKKREMAIAAKLDAEDKMKKESLDLSMRNAGPMKNIFGKSKAEIEKQKADALKKNADKPKKEETDIEENYLNKDGTGHSKEGYHDAGQFSKQQAQQHAQKHGGKVSADPSGKYVVKLPKPKTEELTPAQKAARLQLIKKSAAKLNKKAEMDAKRAMRSDPVLGRRKSDPADHDLVHKEDTHVVKYHDAKGNHKNDSKPMTLDKARAHAAKGNAIDKVGGKYSVHKINEGGPGSGRVSAQDVKQGIGIARDKRYAGGNMTGAVRAMDKLKKGISSHPAVKKELQKQNEDAKQIKENNEMEKKEMMKTQLHFIKYAADEIIEYIDMGGEIEEWYQNKVSKATSEFEGLHAYMEGTARKTGLKEELDSQESDVDYDRKPTFAEFISKLNK